MSARVLLTRKASLDIARQFNWHVENRSEAAAILWKDRLEAALRELERRAAGCPEAIEAEWLGVEIREFDFGRRRDISRVLFRLRADDIEVLRVRHARQSPLDAEDF